MTTDPTSGAPTPSKTPMTDSFEAAIRAKYYAHALSRPFPECLEHARALESQIAELRAALEVNLQTIADYTEWHNDRWPDDKEDCQRLTANLEAARTALAKGREGRGT